ncbi:MAG: OmpA family protein [Pseudomonadota bacterium]
MVCRQSVFLAALLILVGGGVPALAQVVDAETIVRSLMPEQRAPKDRSWNADKTTRSYDDVLRGINIKGALPEDVDLPKVDLSIPFEFDSDRLTNDGVQSLGVLGQALRDPRLQRMRFQIAGHTDGRGSVGYNQNLSERRARTVVDHLVVYHRVDPSRLIPIGYGETRLLNRAVPSAAVNRRVEIINVAPNS